MGFFKYIDQFRELYKNFYLFEEFLNLDINQVTESKETLETLRLQNFPLTSFLSNIMASSEMKAAAFLTEVPESGFKVGISFSNYRKALKMAELKDRRMWEWFPNELIEDGTGEEMLTQALEAAGKPAAKVAKMWQAIYCGRSPSQSPWMRLSCFSYSP